MSKLDEMRRAATLGTRAGTMPPGMDPSQAIGRPALLESGRPDRCASWIRVDRIERDPNQPREDFDEEALARLAHSLRTRGQQQPIRVRWHEERGMYTVVAGERRLRAARLAGLGEVRCTVHEGPIDAGELLALQLIENCVREDLKPIEQSRAFRRVMEAKNWTVVELAANLGIHHSAVSRAVAILDLPDAVQHQVEAGALSPATAYEISKVEDPRQQEALAARVVTEKLTREQTVEARKAAGNRRGSGARASKLPVRRFKAAGCRVTIECKRGVDDALVRAALAEVLSQVGEEPRESEAA